MFFCEPVCENQTSQFTLFVSSGVFLKPRPTGCGALKKSRYGQVGPKKLVQSVESSGMTKGFWDSASRLATTPWGHQLALFSGQQRFQPPPPTLLKRSFSFFISPLILWRAGVHFRCIFIFLPADKTIEGRFFIQSVDSTRVCIGGGAGGGGGLECGQFKSVKQPTSVKKKKQHWILPASGVHPTKQPSSRRNEPTGFSFGPIPLAGKGQFSPNYLLLMLMH